MTWQEVTKKCHDCGKLKPLKDFTKNKLKNDGLEIRCRTCKHVLQRKYYCEHRAKIIEQTKKYAQVHKEKTLSYQQEYRQKNKKELQAKRKKYAKHFPQRIKNADLKLKYGITLIEYHALLQKQEGGCAICGGKPNGKFLSVDHNHKTNKIRGLLCTNCNFIIGHAKDEINILQSTIRYLENVA